MIGKTFGKFTVIAPHEKLKTNRKWVIKCDECGTEKTAHISNIISCKVACKICGKKRSTRFIDIIGQRFERLLVIEMVGKNKWGGYEWKCKCDCGRDVVTTTYNLRKGKVKSCGCYAKDYNTTHGLTKGRNYPNEYKIWAGMKDRCYNKNNPQYKDYGGRGIYVCDRWLHSFDVFISDMGNRISNKHSIDRVNNDGNYEPSNCVWATKKEQNGHTRKSRVLEHEGKSMILADWVRELKMPHATLHYQLQTQSLGEIIQNRING